MAGTGFGALVDAAGDLDWYCPGGLDQPAAFFSLLDPEGGTLSVRPVNGRPVALRYLPGTLIAQTEAVSPQGWLRVEDVAPWPSQTRRLVRLVTALAGPVDVEVVVIPGHAFSTRPRASGWSEGLAFGGLVVRTGLRFDPVGHGPTRAARWRATTRLAAGDRLVVTVDDAANRHLRPLSVDAAARLRDETAAAWRFWGAECTYGGTYEEAVRRSLLLLKGLSTAAGGLAGAASASVGRVAGGERNGDGRLAWLRQVATAAGLWRATGFDDEGQAAEQWLREAISSAPPPFPAVYSLAGGPPPDPDQLDLPGWRRCQPVRVGFQPPRWPDLDLYGDLVAAISGQPTVSSSGGLLAGLAAAGSASGGGTGGSGGASLLDFTNAGPLWGAWPALVAGADWLADHWTEPDCGLWGSANPAGPDTPRRAYTASRLHARFALDRSARLARAVNPLDLDAVGWQQAVQAIDGWLDAHAVTRSGGFRRGSNTTGSAVDGALLRVAWRGPWPATHPRVASTVDAVLDQLGNGPFVYRYPPGSDDGLPGNDNADLEVSAWAVRALAACGRWEEAHERMERLCALAPATGVLAEAVDPATGELLGNLPSAPAHLALVEAALALATGPR